MEILTQIINNKILVGALCSWLAAQILKALINVIVNKEFSLERLFGDGGMPSGHSATVTSMAVITGCTYGFDQPVFAIAAVLAIIVMHDASGVRLETGKQAKIINEMRETILKFSPTSELSNEQKLKEFVGHTKAQVVMGALLGLVIGILVVYFWK